MPIAKQNSELQKVMKFVAQEVKLMQKSPTSFRIEMLSPNDQVGAIKGFMDILEKRYKTSIKVYRADDKNMYDPSNKRFKARPMKPAIWVE
jgi:hypothetical protein